MRKVCAKYRKWKFDESSCRCKKKTKEDLRLEKCDKIRKDCAGKPDDTFDAATCECRKKTKEELRLEKCDKLRKECAEKPGHSFDAATCKCNKGPEPLVCTQLEIDYCANWRTWKLND